MIELLVTVALTAMIIGALSLLYLFAEERAQHTIAHSTVVSQASFTFDQIESTIGNANTCSMQTLGSGQALKCIMPSNGTAADSDGYYNAFTPIGVTRRCTEHWGQGQRVWFYTSNATGNPATAGPYLWRARLTNDNTPTTANADADWTFYYGGTQGLSNSITAISFSVNSALHTVTFNATLQEETRTNQPATSASGSMQEQLAINRTVYWRNWRL